MEILRSKEALRAYIERNREMGKIIGFAPTMGAFHDGHLSLFAAARKENNLVVASIFINPTQFNNPADLHNYPRTMEADIQLLQSTGDVDALYIPAVSDMYPHGTKSKSYDFGGLENQMEGRFRTGHFDGVGTVVEELFLQVRPDNAFFGEKDYQQLRIIEHLSQSKKMGIKIHPVPIMREKNGLAMSSRNERLSSEVRQAAGMIYQTLQRVDEWFRVLSIEEIKKRVEDIFAKEKYFNLEYFVIADEQTLEETDFFYKDRSYRAFIAVYAGEIRLIDNKHLE